MKTPVPRVGNKTPVLQTLYSMFPIHYKEYIDVFGGSGSVLLGLDRMTKVNREIYNDFDHNLTNLFDCMKSRTMALIWELGFCHLNSREDFLAIEHFFQSEAFDDRFFVNEQELTKIMLPPLEAEELNRIRASRVGDYDVRRAAMYFKLLRESYASTGKSYAAQPFDITRLFDTIKMVQYRLKDVVIENQDFETSIRNHDGEEVFFYLDPPYYKTEKYYDGFTVADHARLRSLLGDIQGKFLLSYNDCEEIRSMYAGYLIYDYTRIHSMAQRFQAGKKYKELLIANYGYDQMKQSLPVQMELFDNFDNYMETVQLRKMIKESLIK